MGSGAILDVAVHKLIRFSLSPLLAAVRNATGSVTDKYDEHEMIGGGANFTSNLFERVPGEFRLLQPIWDLRIGFERYVESPLFPIALSVVFYFLCQLPFTIFDLYGRNWKWIQQYKIQPDRVVTWPVGYTCDFIN